VRTTVFAEIQAWGMHRHCSRRWWHRVREWLLVTICGLRGHDFLVHFEPKRMCLECSACRYQTPGWQLAGARRVDMSTGVPRKADTRPGRLLTRDAWRVSRAQ
jgi:hypothetical protein